MKIGCITSDGKSVEQVDLSVVKETVYELEIVVVNHPRHYPKYKVSPQTIAFADTQKVCNIEAQVRKIALICQKNAIFC